jgi:hypothetical protein
MIPLLARGWSPRFALALSTMVFAFERRLADSERTAKGHRQVAQVLWQNARNLPTAAERVRALKQAALHAGLARALDENPNLGRDKCPPDSSATASGRSEIE